MPLTPLIILLVLSLKVVVSGLIYFAFIDKDRLYDEEDENYEWNKLITSNLIFVYIQLFCLEYFILTGRLKLKPEYKPTAIKHSIISFFINLGKCFS
jgi:hypothetical protein